MTGAGGDEEAEECWRCLLVGSAEIGRRVAVLVRLSRGFVGFDAARSSAISSCVCLCVCVYIYIIHMKVHVK